MQLRLCNAKRDFQRNSFLTIHVWNTAYILVVSGVNAGTVHIPYMECLGLVSPRPKVVIAFHGDFPNGPFEVTEMDHRHQRVGT